MSAIAALLLTLVAACGSNTPSSPSGGAAGTTITIQGFAYGSPLTVTPGATVTVVNQDTPKHDVQGDGFKTNLLAKGETGTFTAPTKEGTYALKCSVHSQMSGQLIVKAG